MAKPKRKKRRTFKAVDFFCSGGGMTSGFRKAGVNVVGGIDFDLSCKETYIKNNPGSKFLHSDIKQLSFATLQSTFKIRRNDDKMIFIGCSPCQYWSKIKTIKAKSEDSKNLLVDFQRFVNHFRPGYIVIENVPGILHRSEESPLKSFLQFLDVEGYNYKYEIINACHFGVPQTRKRFLLIASRVSQVALPVADTKQKHPTVREFIGTGKFPVVSDGHIDKTKFLHTTSRLSDENKKRIAITPKNGGTRIAWSQTELQIPAYVGKDDSFQDIYGRMFWDKPAPTITTKFFSITNGRFAHPEQNRGISLREGARLQTFDFGYKFYSTSIAGAAKIIGNAVPPELSKRIAKALILSKNV